ncbi:MAG: T9SS type A sorting domain-containing protein [Candidatus Marinimicrobia bacterium]|nr:T9SS type A sorting domain-containing protein [Candidatus Neomarinimicrobiota bacterium]
MKYLYLTILTISYIFSNTSVFVSDVNFESGYVEVSIVNEEPIVGFQFSITASEELNANFEVDMLSMNGQELTGYNDQLYMQSTSSYLEGFTIFGNENGLIVGFSLNNENLREISPSNSPEGQVLIRVPWSFDLDQIGSVGIDNPKFITPGEAGGPPQYVESSFTEDFPLSTGESVDLPLFYEISDPYPNPFNPVSRIDYSMPIQGNVLISIYDINGRQISILENANKLPGRYSVSWDGIDGKNQAVSSGMYIYQMVSGGFISSGKLMLLK